jgi:hypothetical protein
MPPQYGQGHSAGLTYSHSLALSSVFCLLWVHQTGSLRMVPQAADHLWT